MVIEICGKETYNLHKFLTIHPGFVNQNCNTENSKNKLYAVCGAD